MTDTNDSSNNHHSTEVVIDAPIQVVWEVMTNVNKYNEWNPFIVSVDCQELSMKQGSSMTLKVVFPKHKKSGKITHSKEQVLVLDPPSSRSISSSGSNPKSALWEYRFVSWLHSWNLVRATLTQQLTEIERNKTKYRTEERFHGCLAKFVPLKDVKEGFEAQGAALKAYAERKAHQ
jgi:hypothetical protein